MRNLITSGSLFLAIGLFAATSVNAATYSKPVKPVKKEFCYAILHSEETGESLDQLLVSNVKLTDQQVANVMKKKVRLADQWDVEGLTPAECVDAKRDYQKGYVFYHKAAVTKKSTTK